MPYCYATVMLKGIGQVVQSEDPGPLTRHLVGWDDRDGQLQPAQLWLAPSNGQCIAQQPHAGLWSGLRGPQQQALATGPLQHDGIHADARPALLRGVPGNTRETFNSILILFCFVLVFLCCVCVC